MLLWKFLHLNLQNYFQGDKKSSGFIALLNPHYLHALFYLTFCQVTVSLWERTMCSGSTTQNRPERKGRRRHLLKLLWSLWIGLLLRESFWRNRALTWSRKWRKSMSFFLPQQFAGKNLYHNGVTFFVFSFVGSLRWKSCIRRKKKKQTSFWSNSDWWVQLKFYQIYWSDHHSHSKFCTSFWWQLYYILSRMSNSVYKLFEIES